MGREGGGGGERHIIEEGQYVVREVDLDKGLHGLIDTCIAQPTPVVLEYGLSVHEEAQRAAAARRAITHVELKA